MTVTFGIHKTIFGWCVLGVTKRRVCHLSFIDSNTQTKALHAISTIWPHADLVRDDTGTKSYITKIFSFNKSKYSFNIVMKGTAFQQKVWNALLKIPLGQTSSYKDIAHTIGSPKSVRAVGTACGKNTVGFLIPCHRVLRLDGKLGGYRWGIKRKEAMLSWESGQS